ncbi:hypothetical protein [Foetidibacter luteolus]|uniref:hypothetical protein n=1 Tax=Foetidibacter luteolus TaxID=2608880 RepID=UPI00129B0CBD|nr:hypothetical protein [Foetidibacter luteolus]
MLSRDIAVNINKVMVMRRPGNVIGQMNRQNFNRDVYFGVLGGFRNDLKNLPDIECDSSTVTISAKQRAYKAIIKKNGALALGLCLPD